ncbi:MAG: mandelate racemase/muconate lactonizing enzyme family protein [Candidatus Latescibacterota bacterium]
MKITDVKIYLVEGCWTFVRVFTDEGIVGVGDATNWPGEETVGAVIERLKPLVIGENPFDIERLWQKMYRGLYHIGTSGLVVTAISGIDIALWDIMGKALGTPTYNLLGGRCYEKVRLYTHPDHARDRSPAAVAEACVEIVEAGFTSLKTGIFNSGPLNGSIGPEDLRQGAEVVRAMREAVGEDVDIAIDAAGRYNVQTAIRIARRLEEYDLFFLEEPVPPENVEGMARVAAAVQVPICTGERLFTRHGFREIIERGAAGILMPDVVRTGGITETRKIASLADTYYIPVAPHNPNSPISTLASAHLCATLPNFLVLEFRWKDNPWRDEILTEPLRIEDGHLILPEGPGLGIDLNMKRLKKYIRHEW